MKQTTSQILGHSKLLINRKNKNQETVKEPTNNYEILFKEKTGKDFNTFYAYYYPKLIWLIRKININELDAEEIANLSFMKSLEKIDQYDNQWHYSTWLFNIAKMEAFAYKNKAKRTILIDSISKDSEMDFSSESALNYYVNAITSIDDNIEKKEYDRILQSKYKLTLSAITRLKDKYKEVITLCDIQGKSYEDIVQITGLPMQTVKNRLHHGRLKLEEELKSKFNFIVNTEDCFEY